MNDEKYYSYGVDKDEFLNNSVDIPTVDKNSGFLANHPWMTTGLLFGGTLGLGILATWGTVEWIASATARRIVKKGGASC